MAITRAQQARQMLKKGSEPVVQGGVDNYLGKQPQVVVPRKWQSGPDKPPTELAYITEAEKNLLLKEDIHGSLKEGPNEGPAGIMSLDSFGDIGGAGAAGVDTDPGGGYDTGPRGGGFTGKGGGESPADFKARVAKETAALNKAVKDQEDYFKSEEFKKEKKEAKKKRRERKKEDDARRKSKLKSILAGKKTYNTFKIDPKTGKLVVDETIDLPGQGELQEDGTITGANPFGINEKEYQDLISSLPSYKGPPETPEQRQERINNYLTKNIASTDLSNPLTQLMETNDRFSGVNLETFQNEFNLPKTGLASLDVALGFAEPFLRKGSKKTKEFFSGTEKGLGNTFFGLGPPRKSVLEAGKYTYDGLPIDPTTFAMLDPALMDDVYGDYMGRRMSGEIDAYGNPTPPTKDDDPEMDPCKGPNPPAYCFVNQNPTTPTTPTPTRNLGGLAPRFAGSIFDFTGLADGGRAGAMDGGMMRDTTEGGIMDLETGRQMYFLGKLVKKATRAVKKVAKSPLGKAALLYAGAGALGNLAGGSGLGGMFKGFMSPKSFLSRSKLANIFTRGGAKNILFGQAPVGVNRLTSSGILGTGGEFSLGRGLTLGLGLPLALDLLGVGKNDEEGTDLDDYYKRNRIDIADIRNRPFNFLAPSIGGSSYAAGGGLMRLGYQEGGDAEPVAKKTMPLIDMDGQEKDYRETGGFVDIGRMERADDVPARLSKNEFVFTADAVRNAGEGDIDKGAEVMYNMMKNLEAGGEVSEESQGLDGAREMFKTSQRLEEVL